ncbi:alpha/beta hydrolase fold domain-containing protein [Micromonospora sp. WMMD1102]|uniref:alpha/beta hydrolase fold domain-containing protein n=1 Tax=Micromonospora sp. WMMD1102 TaxID=3016105 RepID=UPI00241565A8|nr:alpha/beta hydrolase fold domain-containing protein [Micromonospora sp. WMMD1102]MDG4790491.1 alpha/beta hydrolase fold domain-containing protein [Micromonospora sp. WMMD1102]
MADIAAPAAETVELRHLRSFVAVADELNFSRAAQRLFLSQPALSRQIRSLERLIGCELFRRSTQRVELTLAGEALLTRARVLLADADEAIAATRAVGGELTARMTSIWQPWVDATADIGDLDRLRSITEELHGRFTPPAEVAVTAIIAGGVPALRLAAPHASDAAILFLHGGGYVTGSAFGYRHLVGAIAASAGMPAVAIDYRLAPEHPYPSAVEDAMNAYRWLLDGGLDPGRIALVGDSSAGGLTLSTLLTLRDRGMALPAAAALLCPWVDLTGRTHRPPQDSPLVFLPETAKLLADAYLDGHPIDDPLVDPLRADLTGLPPLLIHAASGDAVFQEATLLAQHATSFGVPVTTSIFPVPTHDFHLFWTFLPEAATAIDQVGTFLRTTAGTAGA